MMKRKIPAIILATVAICSARVVVSGTTEERNSPPRIPQNIGTSQYMTVDFYEPGANDELVRADEHPDRSRSVVDAFRGLFSHVRTSGTRATRRSVSLEWPATVRWNRASAMAGRSHGRSGAANAVTANVGCHFGIWDEDGDYWDFSYEAKILSPSGSQVAFGQSWAYKPSFSSSLGVDLTDPDEGTYLCKIKWWIGTYELGENEATRTVTYLVPTGETTFGNAWADIVPTAYKWRGRLTGVNFAGRQVTEVEGGGDVDTCWWPNSNLEPAVGLTGGTWDVDSNNEYGDDIVGWMWTSVDYYRSQLRAPCQSETNQVMKIKRPGSTDAQYKVNRLKMGFTSTTVWSYRDGQQQSKNY